MGKYTDIQTNVLGIFNTSRWKAESIQTVPDNFVQTGTQPKEFVRVSVVPSGAGINRSSVSGALIIDIFTEAGAGPKRAASVADKLDSYLQSKTIKPKAGVSVQLGSSSLQVVGRDTDNPSLYRVNYTIPFNYFEVT